MKNGIVKLMEKIKQKRLQVFFRTWFGSLLTAILLATSIKSAIADWNLVPTGSMKPTIIEGDRIFINKLAYDLKVPYTTHHIATWDNPKRGDIVVFYSPADETRLVKRILGIPDDTIAMQNNVLYINDMPLSYELEEYDFEAPVFTERLEKKDHAVMITPGKRAIRSFSTIRVPDHCYFMLGDNRDNSADSRYFGFVDRSRIVGRAVSVVMSLDHEKYYKPRWDRFFTGLR